MKAFEELIKDPIASMGFGLLIQNGDIGKGMATGMDMIHRNKKAQADEEDRALTRLLTDAKLSDYKRKAETQKNEDWLIKQLMPGLMGGGADGQPTGMQAASMDVGGDAGAAAPYSPTQNPYLPSEQDSSALTNASKMSMIGALTGSKRIGGVGDVLMRQEDYQRDRQDRHADLAERERLRIEGEERAAERDRVRRQEEDATRRREARDRVAVPGLEIQDDVIPSANDAETIKALSSARDNITSELDALDALVKTNGFETFGPASERMAGHRKRILLNLKELEKLGVLNGPDLPMLEATLADPTSGTDGMKAGLNAIFGPSMDTQYQAKQGDFRDYIGGRVTNEIKNRGYKLPESDLDSLSDDELKKQFGISDDEIGGGR